ncbi:extracellular solute-binding protein [Bacillus sp. FSL W7-1360]
MKKHTFLLCTSVAALSLVLSACGPDRDEATTSKETNKGDATKPDSLTIWVDDEESQLKAYKEITERFTDETGIDIKITPFEMLEQVDALSLDAPAGNGPDLFFLPNDRTGDVSLQGLAKELTLTDEQQKALEDYHEGAVTALNYEGTQLGIPVASETYALYYNKAMIADAPKTLEDLNTVIEKHTDTAADTYGFLMEATNFYYLYPLLAADGGYVFNQDDTGLYDTDDIGLNNEGAVKGATIVYDWFNDGAIPRSINEDVMKGLFNDGKVSSIISGPWNLGEFSDALGDDLGVAPLPTIDGNPLSSFSSVKGWFVSEYSEHADWATELAFFLTNEENANHFFDVTKQSPARPDVDVNDAHQASFAEQAAHAVPMPNIPEMSRVWEPMENAFKFIAEGTEPKEALDDAVGQIKKEIELSRGQ